MKTLSQESKTLQMKRLLPIFSSFVFISVVLFSLLSCRLLGGVSSADLTATVIAQTEVARTVLETLDYLNATASQAAGGEQTAETPLTPSSTNTEIPLTPTFTFSPTATDTPLPTNTIQPTNTSLVLINEVFFRRGGTSAFFQRTISAGESHIYTVRALEGQTMILSASSAGNDVYLDVMGLVDGGHLVWGSSHFTYWFGTLPRTQPYQITLSTTNPLTTYFLTIEIPANIYFQRGATSATVDGYIDVDENFHPSVFTRVRYLAYASAGQTMRLELTSPNLAALSMGVIGQQDGQAYLRYEVKNNGGVILLPSTQGYYLDVYSVTGLSTSFRLKVTIQ